VLCKRPATYQAQCCLLNTLLKSACMVSGAAVGGAAFLCRVFVCLALIPMYARKAVVCVCIGTIHCCMPGACSCCACRRVDAATASRAALSREEVELIDVAAEMEQQLVQQYTLVSKPAAGDTAQEPGLTDWHCVCTRCVGCIIVRAQLVREDRASAVHVMVVLLGSGCTGWQQQTAGR